MGAPSRDEVQEWVGLVVRDDSGQELGRVERLYADDDSGEPEWLLLHAPGTRNSYFVPVRDTRRDGDAVRVAWPDSIVFTSPVLDASATLSEEDEARLYRHYDQGSRSRAGAGSALAGAARTRLRKLADAAPGLPAPSAGGAPAAPGGAVVPRPALGVAAALALLVLVIRRRRRSR